MSAAFVLATGNAALPVQAIAANESIAKVEIFSSSTHLRAHSFDREDVIAAKQRLPMTRLLDRLCPSWRKRNPIRADDKRNSFSAHEKGWKDHGSGDAGDHITFLEKFEELSRGDAIQRLLELAEVVNLPRKCLPAAAEVVCKIDWSACAAAFTDDRASQLAAWRGLSFEFVQWLKRKELVGIYNDMLAMPENDFATGNLTGVHFLVGNPEDKQWRRIRGTPAQPLVIGDAAAAKWLIFESPWDAFVVMEQMHFHGEKFSCSVLITRGADNGKFAGLIPANAEVTVVMQNDEEKSGGIASEVWLEAINENCPARLSVARPPLDVHDCNDWSRRGEADFIRMIQEANDVTVVDPRRCEDWIDFNAEQETLPDAPELIKGMFRLGEKASLGGSSKSKKTFTGLDLVLSIASGEPWMGIPTISVPVVIVDMELRKKTLQLRIKAILAARGISLKRGQLHIISLRGKVRTADQTLAYVKSKCPRNTGLFFLDPLYKLTAGKDENKAGDITAIMNAIDELGQGFGASVLFSAHYSKGNQSSKESIDRISGSGVFGRDADTIISMTAHEEKDCFTIEPILRSFAPIEPWVVRWNYPVMERASELNPAKLKKAPGAFEAKYHVDQLVEALGTGSLTFGKLVDKTKAVFGMSKATTDRLLKQGIAAKTIEKTNTVYHAVSRP